jgi:predicted nucleic acid-binding protein
MSRFVTGLTVVPVADEICDIFGRERGKLRQPGRTVGDFDLLIAATGLRHGLTSARTIGATSRSSMACSSSRLHR